MYYDKHHYLRKWGILCMDVICVVLSFYLALFIRFNSIHEAKSSQLINFNTIVLLLLVIVYNYVYKNNRFLFSRNWVIEFKLCVYYSIYLMIGTIVVMFVIHESATISRLVILYFGLINTLVLWILREISKVTFNRFYKNPSSYSAVILLVEEGLEDETIKRFNTGLTYKITGILTYKDGNVTGKVDGSEVDSKLENLTEALVPYKCDDIVVNLPNADELIMKDMIHSFEIMGVNFYSILNVSSVYADKANLTRFGDLPVASYSFNQKSSWKLLIKRVFDIIVSIIGLIICFIIGIFVVPAIKLESKGPAIFSQIRIGKNGRRFKFYKFRSMYMDAEEKKDDLKNQNEMQGLMFKIEDDPRITKVGKFIRKTSLDEFPQFFNVLIGDMSVIGTRPPTEDEFKQYNPYYKRRLSMTPGITGLWQVSGRNQVTDFDEVVKLDLEYIDNWSLTLDVEIFFKTFVALIRRVGAK